MEIRPAQLLENDVHIKGHGAVLQLKAGDSDLSGFTYPGEQVVVIL